MDARHEYRVHVVIDSTSLNNFLNQWGAEGFSIDVVETLGKSMVVFMEKTTWDEDGNS